MVLVMNSVDVAPVLLCATAVLVGAAPFRATAIVAQDVSRIAKVVVDPAVLAHAQVHALAVAREVVLVARDVPVAATPHV